MLPVVVLVLLIAWWLLPELSLSSQENGPMIHVVERGDFVHEVTERGNVESASNVEIRCEVKAKNSAGTTILEIVPEGTNVQPGDVLVKLDSSALENDRTQQEIVCSNSEAEVTKALNTYETAKIAKREYLEGKYVQEEQAILSEISEAKENLRQAADYLKHSIELEKKGYIPKLQLEGDQFAVEKAENKLAEAETKLKVLREFTREKMRIDLESDIKTAEANLKAKEHSHKLDLDKLALIESQIEKCVIKAQQPGQVVYANVTNRRGGSEIIIEPGSMVRERQVIIRLPDPNRMQIKAKINEAKVSLVAEEMPVVIHLDAFPELELHGRVAKVNEYPAPTSWYSASIKEYETVILIEESPPGLRPGLTAEVKILVEKLSDVVQVPVQAVFEHGGRHYCVLPDGKGWRSREVQIGSTNDKFVVIRDGLQPGEKVVLGAAGYRDEVDLPELPPETQVVRKNTRTKPTTFLEGERPQASRPGPDPTGTGTSGRRRSPTSVASGMFQQMDANGNGRLETAELSEQMRSRLKDADANGDGAIDRGELTAAMAKMSGTRRGPRQNARPGARP